SRLFLGLALLLVHGAAVLVRGLARFRALGAISMRALPAGAADRGHMGAVAAYDLSALAAGSARLFGRELVRCAFRVGGMAALAGDFFLLRLVHRGETAGALGGLGAFATFVCVVAALRHRQAPCPKVGSQMCAMHSSCHHERPRERGTRARARA